MNIDGLSEATLEKFIGPGLYPGVCGYFSSGHVTGTRSLSMEGFGEKSCE